MLSGSSQAKEKKELPSFFSFSFLHIYLFFYTERLLCKHHSGAYSHTECVCVPCVIMLLWTSSVHGCASMRLAMRVCVCEHLPQLPCLSSPVTCPIPRCQNRSERSGLTPALVCARTHTLTHTQSD